MVVFALVSARDFGSIAVATDAATNIEPPDREQLASDGMLANALMIGVSYSACCKSAPRRFPASSAKPLGADSAYSICVHREYLPVTNGRTACTRVRFAERSAWSACVKRRHSSGRRISDPLGRGGRA